MKCRYPFLAARGDESAKLNEFCGGLFLTVVVLRYTISLFMIFYGSVK